MKKYTLKTGMPRTLAGIGFFGPDFIANSDRMIEKIENSVHMRNGSIEEVVPKILPPVKEEAPAPPVDVEVKLSRKAMFAQHGEKQTNASFLTVQRVAIELGATDQDVAGMTRADLMKFIRERTVK